MGNIFFKKAKRVWLLTGVCQPNLIQNTPKDLAYKSVQALFIV